MLISPTMWWMGWRVMMEKTRPQSDLFWSSVSVSSWMSSTMSSTMSLIFFSPSGWSSSGSSVFRECVFLYRWSSQNCCAISENRCWKTRSIWNLSHANTERKPSRPCSPYWYASSLNIDIRVVLNWESAYSGYLWGRVVRDKSEIIIMSRCIHLIHSSLVRDGQTKQYVYAMNFSWIFITDHCRSILTQCSIDLAIHSRLDRQEYFSISLVTTPQVG